MTHLKKEAGGVREVSTRSLVPPELRPRPGHAGLRGPAPAAAPPRPLATKSRLRGHQRTPSAVSVRAQSGPGIRAARSPLAGGRLRRRARVCDWLAGGRWAVASAAGSWRRRESLPQHRRSRGSCSRGSGGCGGGARKTGRASQAALCPAEGRSGHGLGQRAVGRGTGQRSPAPSSPSTAGPVPGSQPPRPAQQQVPEGVSEPGCGRGPHL